MKIIVGSKVLVDNIHICTVKKVGSAGSPNAIVVTRDIDGKQMAFFGETISQHVQPL